MNLVKDETLQGELEVFCRFLNEIFKGERKECELYIERAHFKGDVSFSGECMVTTTWIMDRVYVGHIDLVGSVTLDKAVEIWERLKKEYRRRSTLLAAITEADRPSIVKEENEKLSKDSERQAELDQGLRYNGGKNRLDLIPCSLIDGVGRVLTFGAQKYAPDNWRKFNQQQVKECIGSAMRHIEQYRQGNWLDPESGLPHLAHAATNLGFILELHKED